MAAKKSLCAQKELRNSSEDSTHLASGNGDSCANNSGAKRKTKIVKSRYMQTEKKSVIKKNAPNETIHVPRRPGSPNVDRGYKPRFGTSPRRTLPAQSDQHAKELLGPAAVHSLVESSNLGGNVLQSTLLDGHYMHPDFELSAIKAPPSLPSTVDSNAKKRILELDTFLLTFITAKMENNTRKLKEEAERNLLILMEEEEKLRSKLVSKKRRWFHLKKQQQLNELLDMQVTFLTPLAADAKQFTEEYKIFSSAIDTTLHELPLKNLHIDEDRGEFLDKAVACLNQGQCLLEQYMKDVSTDSESTVSCLKDIKSAACEIDQNLLSTSSSLLELSSLVSQENVQVRQCLEEDKIGYVTARSLYSE